MSLAACIVQHLLCVLLLCCCCAAFDDFPPISSSSFDSDVVLDEASLRSEAVSLVQSGTRVWHSEELRPSGNPSEAKSDRRIRKALSPEVVDRVFQGDDADSLPHGHPPQGVTDLRSFHKPKSALVNGVSVFESFAPPEDSRSFWLIGIFLTLMGQTICVLGLQLQKISHLTHTPDAAPVTPNSSTRSPILFRSNSEAEQDLVDAESAYFTKWRWMLGGAVWVIGHVMCWFALGLAPQSILACLQSWNILVNLALAPILLGEEVPAGSLPSSLLLGFGCVMVVNYGPKPSVYRMETVALLAKAFTTSSSMIIHVVCVGAMISMWLALNNNSAWRIERSVMMSAMCAWYAALFSKSMAMLAITSVSTSMSQYTHVGFYLFAALFGMFAVAQVHFMNLALKHGFACKVIPLYEGLSLTGQIFFGGLLFGEFSNFHRSLGIIGFTLGVICVLGAAAQFAGSAVPEETSKGKEIEEEVEQVKYRGFVVDKEP
eukprot:TRINITY_DN40573_c0_g1_i1.p1 TRINITY_DN40573_c0_g1~~TRINITY_DN40573_c0_g1_i1.p1  ORF type:complete len:488 (+),score=71.04 TRINITY_DN40573_c0_g1_i1:76-1539(+)